MQTQEDGIFPVAFGPNMYVYITLKIRVCSTANTLIITKFLIWSYTSSFSPRALPNLNGSMPTSQKVGHLQVQTTLYKTLTSDIR